MNTSASGAAYERSYRAQLELDGYVVMRSAASKGPFDLIAWMPLYQGIPIHFIQLKRGRISCRGAKALTMLQRANWLDGHDAKSVVVHKRKDVLFCHHYG